MNSILKELATSGAGSIGFGGLSNIPSIFTRENLIQSMLPKTIAGGINKTLDYFNRGNAEVTPKTSTSQDVKKTDDIIDSDEDDEDLIETLIETMEGGFDETNQALTSILSKLGEDSDVSLTTTIEDNQVELIEALDEDDEMVDLLSINGQILDKLEQIERNTRVDELKAREEELERKSRTAIAEHGFMQSKAEKIKGKDSEKQGDGILSRLLGFLPEIGGGYLGLKAAGKALKSPKVGGIRGAMGKLSDTFKPGVIPTPATSNFPPITLDKVDNVAKAVAPKTGLLQGVKNGVKSVGGKLLGAPLAIGMGAYEAYETHNNADLTSQEKTKEYSKIGGKTIGAVAGAKAGAALGVVGGPIGIAVGGLLGGIGGFFFGEKGGEIVGDLINAVMPSEEPKPVDDIKTSEVKLENIRNLKQEELKTNFLEAASITEKIRPSVESITPGQTKANKLQMLTQQMDHVNAEQSNLINNPIIAPITVNNTSNQQSSNQQNPSRIAIPMIRNQDGTIQRLLDANFKPLMG